MAEEKKPAPAAAPEEKKKENGRRPSALKRNLQSERRRIANRSFKATVQTAIRGYKDCLSKKDQTAAQAQLKAVYSLMDKGVKTGIFKLNKASRTKSRLTQDLTT
jgi:small subunit ribosomal protein S20